MYAILTAGGIPQPGEPLYEYTQGQPKALLELAGKPMIQWVLDALGGAKMVEGIILMGLPPESKLVSTKPVFYMPNQGEMLANILTGVRKALEINPTLSHVLLVSSDIPAVTPEIVDWVVNTALQTDHDLYYSVISRSVMETRFPGSKRTFTHLRDVEVCGGDINVIRTMTATEREDFWRKIIAARKSPLQQASLVGIDVLVGFLLRNITLKAAVEKVSKRIGLRGRVILCPFAEAGMDIDKPHQLEIVRADLERRVDS